MSLESISNYASFQQTQKTASAVTLMHAFLTDSRLFCCCCCSFGQGSSLLWTHTLRPFYSRPIALTQRAGVRLMMCASVCVTEGSGRAE